MSESKSYAVNNLAPGQGGYTTPLSVHTSVNDAQAQAQVFKQQTPSQSDKIRVTRIRSINGYLTYEDVG